MDESMLFINQRPLPALSDDDPVLEQQRRRLATYSTDPTQIRQDANGERREQRDYAERPLLELLQNAEDALSDADRDGAVLLDLSGDQLLVANQGAPFSGRGFQALCSMNDSPKQSDQRCRFIGSKGTGFKAVLNWTDQPEIFSGPIRARFSRLEAASLIRDAIGQPGLNRLEQDGREWRDADMPLLQVPLQAEPDAEILDLQAEGWVTIIRLCILPDQLPRVRQALQDLQPQQMLFLNRINEVQLTIDDKHVDWQFDRKKRPLRDGIACEQLTIRHDRKTVMTWHLLRRTLPETVLPQRSHGSGRSEIGRAEVGLAVQTDGLIDEDCPASICNFFPTLLRSPLPALAVHATFLLNGDRNHLASEDLAYQMQLIDALDALLKDQFIGWLVDCYGHGALQYLWKDPRPAVSENEVEEELAKRLMAAVQSHEFVPTLDNRTAAPESLNLWSHGLGRLLMASAKVPENARLPHPDWCDEDTKCILKGLGASAVTLTEQLKYLSDWVPTSDADACQALELARDALQESEIRMSSTWAKYEREPLERAHTSLEKSIAMLVAWKTQDGRYRRLKENPPFFEKAPSHFDLPGIVPADWLCGAFRKLLNERNLWSEEHLSALRVKHIHSASADNVIEYALLPAVEKQTVEWWQQHGFTIYETLLSIKTVGDDVDDDVFTSVLRWRLAQTIRVPVRGGNWRPAIDVYAGSDHKNPAGEIVAQSVPTESLLLGSKSEYPGLIGKDSLLRYVGVSWSPKWQRHLEEKPRDFHRSIDALGDPPASLTDVEEWRFWFKDVLCSELGQDGERFPGVNIGQWAIKEAWAADGLVPFCLAQGKATDRIRVLYDVWKRGANRRVVRISRQGPNGGSLRQDAGEFRSKEKSGFLYWQLSRACVFDVERSPLWSEATAALSDLLLSSSKTDSWERWLPRLVLGHSQGDIEGAALYKFAHDLGAKKGVDSFPATQWRDWLRALADNQDRLSVQHREQDLSGFLHKLAEADPDADISHWGSDVRFPCLNSGDYITFCRLDDLVVIDDARYLALRRPLMDVGKAVLLAPPKDANRLLERLKRTDRGLSRRLQATVEPGSGVGDDPSLGLFNRWRGLILALVAHHVDNKSAGRLGQHWPGRVLAHTPLHVRLVLDRRDLGVHRQDFHWDDKDVLHVNAGADASPSQRWENLALALGDRCGDSGSVVDALVRLLEAAAQSKDSAAELLFRRGLSQHDIDDWESRDPEDVQPPVAQVPSRGPVPTPDETIQPAPPVAAPIDSGVEEPPKSRGIGILPLALGSPPADPSDPPRSPAGGGTSPRLGPTPQPGAPAPRPVRGPGAREQGERGEAWLREQLMELLTPAGYTVSDRPDQSGGGESDIAIARAAKTLLQIEVKVMTTGEVFWSEFEAKKAYSCFQDSVVYVFAILTPNPNADPGVEKHEEADRPNYQVRWIADPRMRLLSHWERAEVNGRWYWTEQSADRQTLAKSPAWTSPPISEQPERRPSRLSFVIKPREEDYDGEGLEHVRSYLLSPQ